MQFLFLIYKVSTFILSVPLIQLSGFFKSITLSAQRLLKLHFSTLSSSHELIKYVSFDTIRGSRLINEIGYKNFFVIGYEKFSGIGND